MKKIYLLSIFFLALTSCQDELYTNPEKENKSDQGVYITNKGSISIFVEENKDFELTDLKISLAQKVNQQVSVEMEAGSQAQLTEYNKRNGTEFLLLPKDMYEIDSNLTFDPLYTLMSVPVKLKKLKFSSEGSYALPMKIKGGETNIIGGQDETMILFEEKIVTKSLRLNGSGSEDADMFPADFKVPQWTLEVMINRSRYNSNNQSICGTKLLTGSSALDEIYTRFGDVTIDPNQLQIKTGGSQIDVPTDKFTGKPNTWHMITFVYDGKMTKVYIDGYIVAEREIRTGSYGLTGFWLSGTNELIREVRFWKTARTAKQIESTTWKGVNPDDDNLLLYYPMNGKKNDRTSSEIVEDETMIWDWSKNEKHLLLPSRASFDNNNGDGFTFPPIK